MSAAPWARGGLNLELMHKAGAYLMVASTFLALWGGGAFNLVVGVTCALFGAASWFWEAPRVDVGRYNRVWTVITVVFIALCGYLLVFGGQDFVQIGVYLVLFLTLAKLFQRARLIDYQQIFALSFLLLAAATAFNEDVTFGLFFIIYVIGGVITFAMHHLRTQLEENAARGGTHVRQLFGRQYVSILAGLAVLIFLASVVFFFLFPRLGFGFFVTKSRQGAQTTGFSESVNLGTHGTIKSDNTVVMRVEFDGEPPAEMSDLHWRGVTFDHYDGVKWSSHLPTHAERVLRPDRDGEYAINTTAFPLSEGASTIEQRIYLEPINSTVMFALSPALSLRLSDKDTAAEAVIHRHNITMGLSDDLRHVMRQRIGKPFQAMTVGYQYEVTSTTYVPPPAVLRAVKDSDRGRGLRNVKLNSVHHTGVSRQIDYADTYLQLPEGTGRIKALADSIIKDETNDYDRVLAVERYLKSNYTYTTDLPDPGESTPLDAFLFEHKRGHCEFFATSMVILLRSVGIPARSVNGFLGGQWNGFDDFLAVRNADAHSWLEVHFGGVGWVMFDPTPSAANVSNQTSFFDPLTKIYDSLRFKWMKYIIEYDLETQVDFLRNLSNSLASSEEQDSPDAFNYTLRDALRDMRRNALPAMLVFVLALLGGLGIRLRRPRPLGVLDGVIAIAAIAGGAGVVTLLWAPAAGGGALIYGVALPTLTVVSSLLARRRQGGGAVRHTGVTRHYTALRDAIYLHALEPEPGEGPQGLVDRLQASRHALPERAALIEAIRLYMGVRFGGLPFDRDQLRDYKRTVRRIVRALKRSQ